MDATSASTGRTLRRFKKAALLALVSIVGLATFGLVYQSLGEYRDLQRHPPPGKLVDIGGYRLHALVSGEGSPTVVVDGGLGTSMIDWEGIAAEVAKTTRIVIYDRAGMGWSDRGPEPRTSERIVDELHRLLEALEVEDPLVLVGHSFGGVNTRLFYHGHPERVAGLVMVESSHEEMNERFPPHVAKLIADTGEKMATLETLSHFGVVRLAATVLGPDIVMPIQRPLTDELRAQYLRFFCTPETIGTIGAEARSVPESFAQLRAAGASLGDVPLVVITGTESARKMGYPEGFPLDEIDRVWNELQRDLTASSTAGRQIVVKGASHDVQLDAPDAVVEAILDMVQNARAGSLEAVTESET